MALINNLVFLFSWIITLNDLLALAEAPLNGYHYDNPVGSVQVIPGESFVNPTFVPQSSNLGHYQHLQQSSGQSSNPYNSVPANNYNRPASHLASDHQFGTTQVGPNYKATDTFSNTAPPHAQNYHNSHFGGNSIQNDFYAQDATNTLNNFRQQPLQGQAQQFDSRQLGPNNRQIAFNVQDQTNTYNNVGHPCSSEPIVAQFKPDYVDLENGGPLSRKITTCGPNNNCESFTLQADLNRPMAVLNAQGNPESFTDQVYQQQIRPYQKRNNYPEVKRVQTPFVRPPNRRLIEYTEIEQNDIFN